MAGMNLGPNVVRPGPPMGIMQPQGQTIQPPQGPGQMPPPGMGGYGGAPNSVMMQPQGQGQAQASYPGQPQGQVPYPGQPQGQIPYPGQPHQQQGYAPQPGGYPPQVPGAPQLQQPQQMASMGPVVDDPRYLPRPGFDSDSLATRVIQGEPVPAMAPTATAPGQGGVGGIVDGASATPLTLACYPEHFTPCSARHVRITCRTFPNNSALARKFALPLGCVVQPLAAPVTEADAVPVINFGPAGIVRCRRCRSYVNFMCAFTDGGRRWRCSLCQFLNDVPSEYFCPLDSNGRRRDAHERPELCRGTVEFVAPAEYMVRPPMSPAYVFVLDVTGASVASGALQVAVAAIKASLDHMPNDGERTKIGLICFDTAVHYYMLRPGEEGEPSCVVVPDIQDIFLPTPDDTLANFSECRPCFEKLLDKIPTLYASAAVGAMSVGASVGGRPGPKAITVGAGSNAFGAAVKAAQFLLEHNGGKMVCLLCSRPTLGPGAIKDRGDNSVLGTDRERPLLAAAESHYKTLAVELARFQIAADLFLCPPAPGLFMDVATLSPLAKHSGGELKFFGSFDHGRDGQFLYEAICRNLSREGAWEAVMRLRASRGVRCSGFQGRFFLRSTDLMALPHCDEDQAFAVRFSFDETTLTQNHFVVQNALLYTTSRGERRIRVNTIAYPVVSSLSDLMCNIDSPATASILARISYEAVRDRGQKDAMGIPTEHLINALAAYRQLCQSQYAGSNFGGANQLLLPDSMRLLPLYIQGILKTPVIGRDAAGAFGCRLDDKSFLLNEMEVLNTNITSLLAYPNIVPIFPLSDESLGTVEEATNRVRLPPALPALNGSLKTDTVILIDIGTRLFVWIGAAVTAAFLSTCDDELARQGDPYAIARALLAGGSEGKTSDFDRARAIVGMVRRAKGGYGPPLLVVLQGTPTQAMVEALMVEDRTAQQLSYREFLADTQKKVSLRATKT
mmetsp:Transcript_4515/g.8265  ORF Transcript_4515/g.8265 Transcript_4515/m.8265 type:complete len:960 (+) Transcript_4515:1-2880(+)